MYVDFIPMSAIMKLLLAQLRNEIDNSQIQDNNKQITVQNNSFTSEKFKIPVVIR
jgi:hypothetical protein